MSETVQQIQLKTDQFLDILWDEANRLLVVEWKGATSTMTEGEFRAYQKVFAGFVEQKKAVGILVNMSQFHHKPEPDFGEWRVKNISNRYSAAGLKREAFVFPKDAPIPPERNKSFEGEQFPTRAFNDREQAIAWLTQ